MPSPEMDAVAASFAGPFPLDPAEGRAAYDALADLLPPDPEARWEATAVGGAGGPHSEWQWWEGVPAERVLLYLHGGGYVIGRPSSWRQFGGRLSRAAGVRLLNFDYRLAPEHPFPAAVDDAVAAYRWLLAEGLAPEHIVFGGGSAGGGLLVSTMVALRDAGDPLPAGGLSMCPWTDLEVTGASIDDPTIGDPNPEGRPLAESMAAFYLNGADPRHPLASPIHADLHGLPPIHVELAERDAIQSDALALYDALRAAGNAATLTRTEGAIHGFEAFAPETPEAAAARNRFAAFLGERLGALA